MSGRNRKWVIGVVGGVVAIGVGFAGTARADGGGWFIGGLVTSKVLHNMERRTQAQEAQAYNAPRPQPVQRVAPAPQPAKETPEQRMKELDKLAAGGYVTPEEYKAKKRQILEGL